jgi:hypothetical protein
MTHPYLLPFTNIPQSIEQRTIVRYFKFGASELLFVRGLYSPPKLGTHCLLAIANAKDWYAEIKN